MPWNWERRCFFSHSCFKHLILVCVHLNWSELNTLDHHLKTHTHSTLMNTPTRSAHICLLTRILIQSYTCTHTHSLTHSHKYTPHTFCHIHLLTNLHSCTFANTDSLSYSYSHLHALTHIHSHLHTLTQTLTS